MNEVSAESLLELPTLVLNAAYVPIRVTTVRVAFSLLYSGRALALDQNYMGYDFARWLADGPPGTSGTLPTVRGRIAPPRVLLLKGYRTTPTNRMRLSRRNLMLRDNYQCQYCGDEPGPSALNLDHVMPRSRGGDASWTNLVVACRPCNQTKANRTPKEAAMRLRKTPAKPNWTMLLSQLHARDVDEWAVFLPELRAVS